MIVVYFKKIKKIIELRFIENSKLLCLALNLIKQNSLNRTHLKTKEKIKLKKMALNLLARTAGKTLLIRSPVDQLNYEFFSKTILRADGIKKPCIPIKKQEVSNEDCGFPKKIKTTPPNCEISESKDQNCDKGTKPDNRSCEEILKKKEMDEKKKPENQSCEEILKKQEKKKSKKDECPEVLKKPEVPDKSDSGTNSLCEEIFKKENVKNKDGKSSKIPSGVPGCSCSFVPDSSFLIPTFHNKHRFYAMKF